jgi:hypothetical protein
MKMQYENTDAINGIIQTSKMNLTADQTKLTTRVKLTEFGVSMPVQLVRRLDDVRGDIPRSRFLLRLVERELKEQEEQEGEEKLQQGTQVGSHRRPAPVVEATDNPQQRRQQSL